jgi:hypothetical protein
MREHWERGGEAPGKKISEKTSLTTTPTPAKVSESLTTKPNKIQ